jgi:hypothetical protein
MTGEVAPPSRAALWKGEVMIVLFRIGSARWSATVSKVRRGTFQKYDIALGVAFHCDGEPITRYGFCASFKDVAGKCEKDAGPVAAYAELFGFSLSKADLESLRCLVFTTNALCECVQQGGSVEGWCKRQGQRPSRERKAPRRRTRPSPLVVQVKEQMFVLSPQRFSPN